MKLIEGVNYHEDCDTSHCEQCRTNNALLVDRIYTALGDRGYDWLGVYHTWLKSEGIFPETDGGWWSREALQENNVDRFIAARV